MRPAAFVYLSCAVHGAAVTAALGFSAYVGSRAALTPPLVQVQPSEPSAPSAAAAMDLPPVVVEAVVDEPIAEVVPELAAPVAEPVAEAVAEAEANTPAPQPPAPQPTLQRIVKAPPVAAAEPAAVADAPADAPAAPPQAWVEAKPAVANEPPRYPESERLAGREDTVVVAITVDERGAVLDVALRQPSRFAAFNREALRAARGWRFEPARHHGVAVPTTFDKRIEFRLEPAPSRR